MRDLIETAADGPPARGGECQLVAVEFHRRGGPTRAGGVDDCVGGIGRRSAPGVIVDQPVDLAPLDAKRLAVQSEADLGGRHLFNRALMVVDSGLVAGDEQVARKLLAFQPGPFDGGGLGFGLQSHGIDFSRGDFNGFAGGERDLRACLLRGVFRRCQAGTVRQFDQYGGVRRRLCGRRMGRDRRYFGHVQLAAADGRFDHQLLFRPCGKAAGHLGAVHELHVELRRPGKGGKEE